MRAHPACSFSDRAILRYKWKFPARFYRPNFPSFRFPVIPRLQEFDVETMDISGNRMKAELEDLVESIGISELCAAFVRLFALVLS